MQPRCVDPRTWWVGEGLWKGLCCWWRVAQYNLGGSRDESACMLGPSEGFSGTLAGKRNPVVAWHFRGSVCNCLSHGERVKLLKAGKLAFCSQNDARTRVFSVLNFLVCRYGWEVTTEAVPCKMSQGVVYCCFGFVEHPNADTVLMS